MFMSITAYIGNSDDCESAHGGVLCHAHGGTTGHSVRFGEGQCAETCQPKHERAPILKNDKFYDAPQESDRKIKGSARKQIPPADGSVLESGKPANHCFGGEGMAALPPASVSWMRAASAADRHEYEYNPGDRREA